LTEAERDYWRTVRSKTKLFPEAKGVLEKLASGYKLALITNTQGLGSRANHRITHYPEMASFFETTIIAGEGDVPAKPSPEPFLRCLAVLEIEPHEAVYVGDDWRIDICGAQAVGIHPVWLQHQSVTRKWPKVETSIPVITSLEPLLDLGTKEGIIL
jgi:putative hydrolase of the HAD superfamily